MKEQAEIISQLSRLERSSRRTLPFLFIGLLSVIIALFFAARDLDQKDQVETAAANAELNLSTLRAEVELLNHDLQSAEHNTMTVEERESAIQKASAKASYIQQSIEKAQTELAEATPVSLKPRVYFHISTEKQRTYAATLAKSIAESDTVIVPGIQRVSQAPNRTELRYFRPAEKSEAEAIATTLRNQGLKVDAKLIPGYETSTAIRPRHYELWIAAD